MSEVVAPHKCLNTEVWPSLWLSHLGKGVHRHRVINHLSSYPMHQDLTGAVNSLSLCSHTANPTQQRDLDTQGYCAVKSDCSIHHTLKPPREELGWGKELLYCFIKKRLHRYKELKWHITLAVKYRVFHSNFSLQSAVGKEIPHKSTYGILVNFQGCMHLFFVQQETNFLCSNLLFPNRLCLLILTTYIGQANFLI